METQELKDLINIKKDNYGNLSAREFADIVCNRLGRHGKIKREVTVLDRGDGRKGRIDVVFNYRGEKIPIEIDRISPRSKSIFKIRSYNPHNCFVITRSPYNIKRFRCTGYKVED